MPLPSLRPAVFLDRDGTLNAAIIRAGRPYPPATVDEFRLLDGVAANCTRLKSAGYILVVATNQPDVGRGSQTRDAVEAIHARLSELIPEIDLIQVCYHGGTDHGQSCPCRKPKPGMLSDAAHRLGLDLKRSWMVGDRWRDVDCGHAAGCRTIFIDWGYDEKLRTRPDFVVKTLAEATGIILAQP
ncbi:MAG: HAD family hydrolase [Lacunisphaera sp.]